MPLFFREPAPPLAEFVSAIWLAQGHVPGPHRQERILPAGDCTLVVDLSDDYAYAALSGPHSRFFEIDTAAQFSVAGVVFKPGAAFPFFNVPQDELVNDHVPLEDLWGRVAAELRERVVEARTPEQKLAAFADVLVRRITCAPARHPAVVHAVEAFQRAPGAAVVADVVSQIGLSHRRFLDIFTAQVGLTPKVFCRILRFHRALQQVERGRDVDWTEVAQSSGYYDQAHFIHDFRAFSGMSPTTYELRRVSSRHVAIVD